jgi:hypothetical protein
VVALTSGLVSLNQVKQLHRIESNWFVVSERGQDISFAPDSPNRLDLAVSKSDEPSLASSPGAIKKSWDSQQSTDIALLEGKAEHSTGINGTTNKKKPGKVFLPNTSIVNKSEHHDDNDKNSAGVQFIHPVCRPLSKKHDGKQLFHSSKLLYTSDPEMQGAHWLVECLKDIDLFKLLNESMYRRCRAAGVSDPLTLSTAKRNEILRGWRVYLFDLSDWPLTNYLFHLLRNVSQIVGWERLYLITRSATSRRSFHRHGATLSFNFTIPVKLLPRPIDYSTWIGSVCAGIKHYHFPVRDDIYGAFLDVLKNSTWKEGSTFVPDPVLLKRPKDVAHFWDPQSLRMSHFRSAVSNWIRKLADPPYNLSAFGDIVGWRAMKGRHLVHPQYLDALLQYKIIVVCQRDRYEDHMRLFEALVSGAMVISDHMYDFPAGIEDNNGIVVFQGLGDLREKILYYLEHKEERLTIAKVGRITALRRHREWHRWEDILLNPWNNRNEYGLSKLNPGMLQQ